MHWSDVFDSRCSSAILQTGNKSVSAVCCCARIVQSTMNRTNENGRYSRVYRHFTVRQSVLLQSKQTIPLVKYCGRPLNAPQPLMRKFVYFKPEILCNTKSQLIRVLISIQCFCLDVIWKINTVSPCASLISPRTHLHMPFSARNIISRLRVSPAQA